MKTAEQLQKELEKKDKKLDELEEKLEEMKKAHTDAPTREKYDELLSESIERRKQIKEMKKTLEDHKKKEDDLKKKDMTEIERLKTEKEELNKKVKAMETSQDKLEKEMKLGEALRNYEKHVPRGYVDITKIDFENEESVKTALDKAHKKFEEDIKKSGVKPAVKTEDNPPKTKGSGKTLTAQELEKYKKMTPAEWGEVEPAEKERVLRAVEELKKTKREEETT